MTIARYLSKFANLLNSDGKVVNAGIANNTLQSDKFASGTLGNFRNRIINGDMKIAQRGSSFPAAVSGTFLVDRFQYGKVNASVVNISQNTDVPSGSGLSNSLRATVTTADTSIAAGDYSFLLCGIEGYNVADLVGVPITLSFWVRSSKTGIHCVCLRNSATDRTYVSEYVIATANTWEKKSITILGGLITTGTWNFTDGRGLEVGWSMACGSSLQTTANNWISSNAISTANQVNCLDTVGNIFAITGVQLEKGSVASEFEFRPVSTEYALCQRYYNTFFMVVETSVAHQTLSLPVTMRTSPTVSVGGSSFTVNNVNPTSISIYEGARVGRTVTVTAEF